MKRDFYKSFFINFAAIFAATLIYGVSGSLLQLAAGIIISVLLGYSVTKHHYMLVAFECTFVLIAFAATYFRIGGAALVVFGITTGVFLVLLGIALGLSSKVKMSASSAVLMCGAIYLINMLISFAFLGDGGSFESLLSELRLALSETIQMQYADIPELISAADELISEIMAASVRFMPSVMVCSAGMSALILVFVYSRLIVKLNKNIKSMSFSMLCAERSMSILFIITLALLLLVRDALWVDVLLNVAVISCFVFYICGLSHISYLLRERGKRGIFRAMLVIVVLPLSTMMFVIPFLIIAGFGLVDSLSGFRYKNENRKEENDNDGAE